MILGLGNALSSIALRTGASSVSSVSLATDTWSVYFDGSDDHIIIPDSNDFSFTDGAGNDEPFSISAWVKLAELTTARIVSKEDGTNANREYLFGTDGADLFNLILGTSTDNLNVAATTSTELTVDTWHHIIATYDGSNAASGIKLYVDGSAISTTDVSIGTYAGMPNSAGNLKVGRFDVNGSVMDGRAAQVDIWSSELTATEVSELYNAGTPVDPTVNGGDYVSSGNLVGSWDMENTGTTTVTDNSANSNDGTLTNGAAFDADVPVITIPTWADNRSVLFDGTDDFLYGNFDASGYSGISIEAWFKADTFGAFNVIASQFLQNTPASSAFFLESVDISGTDELWFGVSIGSNFYAGKFTTGLTTGVWYHAVGTYDGSTVKVYVNGVVGGTTASITGNLNSSTYGFKVARLENAVGYFDGRISEVNVWNSALTADEVTARYNSGTPISPLADSGDYASSADLTGSWPLEAGSGITALDYSGNGNHGLLINGPLWDADTPVITIPAWSGLQSVLLDGTNDLISIPDDNVFSFGNGSTDGAFSVSAWIKIREVTGIYFPIFAKRDDGNTDYEWVFDITSAGHLRIILFSGNSSANQIYARSSDNHDAYEGTWIHVLATYDGGSDKSGLKVYRNGVNDTDFSFEFGTYVAMSNTSAPLLLGSFGTQFADGRISEMCLWSSELTAANVTSLYNSGTPIDSSTIDSANVAGHWPLEAGSGKTAIDYSGNGNHGTLTNGPTWSSDTP